MKLDVTNLGQVFTPSTIVKTMVALRQRNGRVLEPAAGRGAFLSELTGEVVAIELDSRIISDPKVLHRVLHCDFFAYPRSIKFDTIIGNPPYVRHQDIAPQTKALLDRSLFDKRTNLYLFFINKCIDHLNDHGELILITPRDFMKATSAQKLNSRLYREGTITHFYDLGDAKIFQDAMPNCAIWRWQKGRRERRTETGGSFHYKNGQLWFGKPFSGRLGDYFDIKVGAVSGADKIFTNQYGGTDFVCSTTIKDRSLRRMIYNQKHKSLYRYKAVLMQRKIRKFNESNWWQWGRKYHQKKGRRVYVNCKTRMAKPFFASNSEAYDGSVLALFPRKGIEADNAAQKLNGVDWQQLGFVCDGRLLFTQQSLENAPVEI